LRFEVTKIFEAFTIEKLVPTKIIYIGQKFMNYIKIKRKNL